MRNLPITPMWLKRSAWAAAAVLGTTACILVCMVENLLDGGFPWAFLLLCVFQVCLCVTSAVICGRRFSRKWPSIVLFVSAFLLTAAVLVLTAFWLSFFRS